MLAVLLGGHVDGQRRLGKTGQADAEIDGFAVALVPERLVEAHSFARADVDSRRHVIGGRVADLDRARAVVAAEGLDLLEERGADAGAPVARVHGEKLHPPANAAHHRDRDGIESAVVDAEHPLGAGIGEDGPLYRRRRQQVVGAGHAGECRDLRGCRLVQLCRFRCHSRLRFAPAWSRLSFSDAH